MAPDHTPIAECIARDDGRVMLQGGGHALPVGEDRWIVFRPDGQRLKQIVRREIVDYFAAAAQPAITPASGEISDLLRSYLEALIDNRRSVVGAKVVEAAKTKLLSAIAILREAAEARAENSSVRNEIRDLRRALDFFDRVKVASEAEKSAVGTDHWTWLESAARSVVAAEDVIASYRAGGR